MRYLSAKEIIAINETILENANEGLISVLDQNGLDSIVNAPKQEFFGKEAYPTIWLKSAYYLQKIAKKHVFADGNKRTALQTADFFLYLNGYDLNSNKLGQFVLNITTSPDSEDVMLLIAKTLKENSSTKNGNN